MTPSMKVGRITLPAGNACSVRLFLGAGRRLMSCRAAQVGAWTSCHPACQALLFYWCRQIVPAKLLELSPPIHMAAGQTAGVADVCPCAAGRLVRSSRAANAYSPIRRAVGLCACFIVSGMVHELIYW